MLKQKDQKRTLKKSLALLSRFLPYYRPYAGVLTADLLCAALTTVCELILPLIVRYLTDTATNNLAELTVSRIFLVGGVYLLLRLMDAMAYYYQTNAGHVMGARIETDLRHDLFAKYQDLSNAFYDEAKVGQLMSRITTDLNDVTEFAHHYPEEVFICAIKALASFVILSYTNVSLTLIIYACLPVLFFCSSKFNRNMRKTFRESRHKLGELNAQVEDSLLGIRVVKAFTNESVEEEKFEQGNHGFLRIKREMYRWLAAFHMTTRLFDGLLYILVVVVGALYMIRGAISPADLVAYLLYATMLLNALRRFVEFTEQFQRGISGLERFFEVIDEPIEIHDVPGATPIGPVRGDVTFENVCFSYKESAGNVLNHINLHVPAGQSVALVGPSGGGKTTLCNLIPRFYEVTSGRILIDGQDIRNVTIASLREQIGMVQQEVYLFSGSILDNIAYGRPGATRSEIVEAAKMAGAHEFISVLPRGYDTYAGERGVRLSGGQKQRIAIARVFLKNPPLLILDEATSALDNESELIVQKSLERLMKGRTTFTIAHRLTTIRNADCILVLTDQGIVEQGTHARLIADNGLYHKLYEAYAQADFTTNPDGTVALHQGLC